LKPIAWLPRAAAVQIPLVMVAHVILGFLSVVGWWELVNEPYRHAAQTGVDRSVHVWRMKKDMTLSFCSLERANEIL
jgi:hypothetical protein